MFASVSSAFFIIFQDFALSDFFFNALLWYYGILGGCYGPSQKSPLFYLFIYFLYVSVN